MCDGYVTGLMINLLKSGCRWRSSRRAGVGVQVAVVTAGQGVVGAAGMVRVVQGAVATAGQGAVGGCRWKGQEVRVGGGDSLGKNGGLYLFLVVFE
jgi:hypothetical protein